MGALEEAGPCVTVPRTTPRFGDSQGKDTEPCQQREQTCGVKSGVALRGA